jgi:hypothetical protein
VSVVAAARDCSEGRYPCAAFSVKQVAGPQLPRHSWLMRARQVRVRGPALSTRVQVPRPRLASNRVATSPLTTVSAQPLTLATRPARRRLPRLSIGDWKGLVRARSDEHTGVVLVGPISDMPSTWAGPFRAVASDNREYFIKSLETCPFGQGASLAVELIVSRIGDLIGAPVCETSLIQVPEEFDNYEVRPGTQIRQGWAHGSLAIERAALVRRDLGGRNRNDNARRHVGAYALYDWCFGEDRQWLHDLDDDRAVYSHDHGLYFPTTGTKSWTREQLLYKVGDPHELPEVATGLSSEEIERVAHRIENVPREAIVEILNSVPSTWPVSNEDLEALGFFLETRAPDVAGRLRMLDRSESGDGR